MENYLQILVVDDEPNIRTTLKEFFTAIGRFDVDTAGDGLEALEKIQAKRYDAAFLDLQMPRMTGLELLHRVKEFDNTLPVIIMTGFPSLDAAIDTMRHGATDFLTKPVRLGQLKIVLERVLRERRLLVENLRLQDQLRQKEQIEALNRSLTRKVKEQALLYNVSESLALTHSSDNLYRQVADMACDLVSARKSLVLLLNREDGLLLPLAAHGLSQAAQGSAFPADGGFLGRTAWSGQPVIFNSPNEPLAIADLNQQVRLVSGSILGVPLKVREEMFGLLVVADKDGTAFTEEDLFLIQFLATKASLSVENLALYDNLWRNLTSSFRSLVSAIEAKDAYTERHSHRVTEISVRIAESIGLPEDEIASIRFSGYLHDIGKIGIRDEILAKAGPLTEAEYETMKTHPIIGERIVGHLGLLDRDKSIIRHHHESWDGRGYPDGLGGRDIPLLSRILIVADSFDAMTSNRPYRMAMPLDKALAELERKKWIQFDGEMVDVFLGLLSQEEDLLDRIDQAPEDPGQA